jgi:hypothetical protein
MQDKGISPCVEQDETFDRAIMGLLLGQYHGLWKIEEIEREIGDPICVQDSVARLHAAGLIHRLEDFVFPSVARWPPIGCSHA